MHKSRKNEPKYHFLSKKQNFFIRNVLFAGALLQHEIRVETHFLMGILYS